MPQTDNNFAVRRPGPRPWPKEKSGFRRRLWTIGGAFIVLIFIGVQVSNCGGAKLLAELRSLQVDQVARVTIYDYHGRHKKVLRVIEDPAALLPFVEAMNQLKDYTPNHPAYTGEWYVVLDLNDGSRIGLTCMLRRSQGTNVYMEIGSTKWYVPADAEVQSDLLYDWLIEHAGKSTTRR